jgi:protein involved in polysaccharide export with SLBB domain
MACPQSQSRVDCASPAGFSDPRCQSDMRPPTNLDRQEATAASPRIPIIRDQGPPQSQMERDERGQPAAQAAPRLRRALPPEQPTEFQKFVEQSTGHLLPVFGQDLFQEVPSTFAPADRVPVTPEYALGPGDQLLIRGWGQIDLNVSPVVDRSGSIYIPQVGELAVAGLKFAQIQDYLKTAVGRVFRNFDLSVSMGQLRSMQVFVVGHARQPGAYTISSLSTLVNAIFASGGPDSHGSMRDIRLLRSNNVVTTFDFYDLLLGGDKSKDRALLPGDVIYIPPVGPQVALTGSLNTPAIYELREASTLKEALQFAGGFTPVAETQRAAIERIENSSRKVVLVSLGGQDTAAIQLKNGDIVNILAIVPKFANTVTLRGNVADQIRMPWHSGMRIRDLIPDREALLTRDYWRNRNRLVIGERPLREGESSSPDVPDSQATSVDPQATPRPGNGLRDAGYGPSTNQEEPLARPAGAAGGNSPGSIAANKSESSLARNRVDRNVLEINWSYAVIERLDPQDLKTSLIPFRLGKAIIDGDAAENLPLEPGDVVTIFSTSDLKVPQGVQTRYVRLEGEIESAGSYSVRPGETLRQLVKRAGGLTSQAYLFGSEFLRKSSQLEQQQRLDDLANSLERQVASSAANVRGAVISPEEAAAATSQINGQRDLVQKLREVRATGRIVLDLDPRVPGVDSLPDLQLEDGDVFAVPSIPSFVNVVGSVPNSTSFLYQGEKRIGDYLREAGGPGRTADSRHTFLIRADGSVVSKSWGDGLLAASFEGLRLNPGDTIVIPEQINKTTFLKGLKDWSQVFAQFALGAAAINILK